MTDYLVGQDMNIDLIGHDNEVEAFLAAAGQDVHMGTADKNRIAELIIARNAAILRETKPTKVRTFPLGFLSDAAVAAGASVTVISRPQVLFRGQRLVIPSDIAGDFSLDDVKVGKNSQFVAEGAVPGRVMQENARDVAMILDTAKVSQDISLSVTNISGAARTFRAALFGLVLE